MSKEIDDLTETLAERKQKRSKLYSEVSSELKSAAITNDVSFKRQNLMTAAKRPRADLSNAEDVRQRTNEFLLACEKASVVPTFLGLCTALGFTRQGVYHFLNRSPDSPSAMFLEVTREMLADALITSGLTRTTDSAVSIFALKNLHGFVDRLSVEAVSARTRSEVKLMHESWLNGTAIFQRIKWKGEQKMKYLKSNFTYTMPQPVEKKYLKL